MKSKSTSSRIYLILFSTVLSLVLAEVVLRVVRPSQVIGVGTDRAGSARYYGWAFPPNEPVEFIHPDTGRVFRGDRTNSGGWKDVDHSTEKPRGAFRILFIGDSVTFGVVPFDRLYTRQCEQLLHEAGHTNVEVISMGVGGWGTDQSLEALRREGIEYQPDLVIYQFCGNDVTDNLQPTPATPRDSIFQKKPFRYEVGAGGLVKVERTIQREPVPLSVRLKKVLLKSALVWNVNQARHSLFNLRPRPWEVPDAQPQVYTNANGEVFSKHLRTMETNGWWAANRPNPLSRYFPYRFGEEPGEMREAWHLLELLILEMKSISENHGARFLVFSEESEPGKRLYCLSWDQFQSDANGDFILKEGTRYPVNWKRYEQDLRQICERHGIPLITPTRSYGRYQYDPHANAEGNLAMAKDIAEFLTTNRMLQATSAD